MQYVEKPWSLPSTFLAVLYSLLANQLTSPNPWQRPSTLSWKHPAVLQKLRASRLIKSPHLWNQKVHYPDHNRPPTVPVLSQINPVHANPFNLTLILILSSLLRVGFKVVSIHVFPHQNFVCISFIIFTIILFFFFLFLLFFYGTSARVQAMPSKTAGVSR